MYSKLLGMIPRSSCVNVSESSEGPGEEGGECRVTLLRPALSQLVHSSKPIMVNVFPDPVWPLWETKQVTVQAPRF